MGHLLGIDGRELKSCLNGSSLKKQNSEEGIGGQQIEINYDFLVRKMVFRLKSSLPLYVSNSVVNFVTEPLRLEGSSGDHLVQWPCSAQGQLQQAVQLLLQMHFYSYLNIYAHIYIVTYTIYNLCIVLIAIIRYI